jgi:hypothetical protein
MSEFLQQPSLDVAEGALAAAAGLRRTGQYLTDAERAQGLADLAVLLVGHFAGPLVVTEMAAAIGVELAEAAVVAHHRLQSGEGRGGTLLREEPGVQDAAVGIVSTHYQVLHGQA